MGTFKSSSGDSSVESGLRLSSNESWVEHFQELCLKYEYIFGYNRAWTGVRPEAPRLYNFKGELILRALQVPILHLQNQDPALRVTTFLNVDTRSLPSLTLFGRLYRWWNGYTYDDLGGQKEGVKLRTRGEFLMRKVHGGHLPWELLSLPFWGLVITGCEDWGKG